jgi:hypothetical protein
MLQEEQLDKQEEVLTEYNAALNKLLEYARACDAELAKRGSSF